MKYTTIRDQVQSGDLVALSHSAWASWRDLQIQAVRFGTESEYSHVGMTLVYGGRVWLLESVQPVVRMVPLSNMVAGGFFWIPMQAPVCEAELEFALAEVGTGEYSRWQAVLAVLRQLRIGVDHIWQCAEYVIACRRQSGVDLGDEATPSAVVRAAQEMGKPCYLIGKK